MKMKKILAHTTGKFMLLDGMSGDELDAFRPSVVRQTPFINTRVGLNQVEIVAELKREATDAEYVRFLKEADGDFDVANESFLAVYGIDAEPTEAGEDADTAPATSRRRRS